MAKAIIEGFLFLYTPQSTKAKPVYTFHESDISGDSFIKVRELTLEAEIPDDFDPRPIQIEALKAKKTEMEGKFYAATSEIDRRISQLQAIEYVTVDALDDDRVFEEEDIGF